MTKTIALNSHPFGTEMVRRRGFNRGGPTRGWSDANRQYRYGFNGMEKDFETANDDYDFGARIYDGRLGRWLSLDPLMKKYTMLSPYNFVDNSPIYSIDKDGKDIIVLCAPIRQGHSTGHQAVLIGNDKDGWYYYSFDGFADSETQNDGKTNGVYFSSISDFANSEYNSYQSNYDDEVEYSDAERDFNGKIIQRFEQGYRIVTSAATDKKMKVAVSEFLNTHNYLPSINDCTDLARIALNEAGKKNGETTRRKGSECDEFGNCVPVEYDEANYLPETKQSEIEKNNDGKDVDNLLKRTTTDGNITPPPSPSAPEHVESQRDNTSLKIPEPTNIPVKKR